MRHKRRVFLILGCVLAALLVVWILPTKRRPIEVTVTITDCRESNGMLLISAAATNVSKTAFLYEAQSPLRKVRWESTNGWNCTTQEPSSWGGWGYFPPGTSLTNTVSIPSGATRIKVNCEVLSPELRVHLARWLTKKGWAGVVPEKLMMIIPEIRIPVEFWSEEMLLPNTR
jgi:hypothetical protein